MSEILENTGQCKSEIQPMVYTVAEVATLLHISLSKAYELTKSNRFTVVELDKKILVPKKEFHQWFDSAKLNQNKKSKLKPNIEEEKRVSMYGLSKSIKPKFNDCFLDFLKIKLIEALEMIHVHEECDCVYAERRHHAWKLTKLINGILKLVMYKFVNMDKTDPLYETVRELARKLEELRNEGIRDERAY